MKQRIKGVELEVPEPRVLFADISTTQMELIDLMISVENEIIAADGGRRRQWRSFYRDFRTLLPVWTRYVTKPCGL